MIIITDFNWLRPRPASSLQPLCVGGLSRRCGRWPHLKRKHCGRKLLFQLTPVTSSCQRPRLRVRSLPPPSLSLVPSSEGRPHSRRFIGNEHFGCLVSGGSGSGDYRRGVLGPGSSSRFQGQTARSVYGNGQSRSDRFRCSFVERICKKLSCPPLFFRKKWGRDLGFFLSFSVGQLLTSKIGRGDNASLSFGSRCHVIYSLIYLFSGSEAERFSAAPYFFFSSSPS